MLILSVNNYNYINFKSKVTPRPVVQKIDSELINESILLDIRIKEFLQNLIDNNAPMSQTKIAEKLELPFSTLTTRIYKNDKLHALWNKVKSGNIAKSQNINNKIKMIMEEFLLTKTPVKVEEIAEKVGLRTKACYLRIYKTPELKEIWEQLEKAPMFCKSEASLSIDAKIKEFLENAILNNLTILSTDISKVLGIKSSQINDRIRRTPALKELWNKLEHNKFPKKNSKYKEKDNIIKNVLEKALKENSKLTLSDISEQTGFTLNDCHHRVYKNQDLNNLWNQVTKTQRSKRPNIVRGEDRIALIKKIQLILENALKNGEQLFFGDIAKECNITKSTTHHIIYKTPELNKLWTQIGHGEVSKTKTQEFNSKIEQVLKNAIKNNIPLLIEDIAQELNSTVPTVKGRIIAYPELKSLWAQTPRRKVHYKPQTSMDKTTEIKKVLEDIIKEKRSVMLKELAEEIRWNYMALKCKIKKNPILKDLWNQIERKKISNSSIQTKENIKEILDKAIKNNTYISAIEIANMVGISHEACIQRLNKTPELLMLWNKVQNLKTDDFQVSDNKIKEFLLNCLNTNVTVNIDDIVLATGISKENLSYRFRLSNELKSLWEEVKNIETKNLQQLYKMKKNGTASAKIKKTLNLDDEKYDKLNTRYKKVKSALLSRFKDCNPEDVLNWAFLSKREFELGINELFSKMGYKSQTTRYRIDNGIDVVAEKEGKRTYIECMHNLFNLTHVEELLMLQGNKYYYDTDNVIYVATSGVTSYGQKFADKVSNNFKIMTLRDITKLAKKYNVNVENLEEKGNIDVTPNTIYGGNWILPQKSDTEKIAKLREMNSEEFEKTVTEFFTSKGYAVKKADELNLDGYYIVIKGNHKSIIKCHKQNSIPTTDSVKALYGMKDYYEADDVILIGAPGISSQSKEFIDIINKKEPKHTYKLYSLDKMIIKNPF